MSTKSQLIYIFLIIIVNLLNCEAKYHKCKDNGHKQIADVLHRRIHEKIPPLHRKILKESSNVIESDEAYQDMDLDVEDFDLGGDSFRTNNNYVKAQPKAAYLKYPTNDEKMKREMNLDGLDDIKEEQESSYNKLLNELKHKFYEEQPSENLLITRDVNILNVTDKPGTSTGTGTDPTNFMQKFIGNLSVKPATGNPEPTVSNETYADAHDPECTKLIDPTNATSVLERVLEELESIRMLKQGNNTPEGTPCDIEGSWNSEIIGLRFDLNFTSNNNAINVGITDKFPQRRSFRIDKTWNCTGFTLNKIGGPFYLTCLKKSEALLGLFTGICKNCGGYNTIFGSWTFAHHPRDCQELHTFIDIKNDVFRRETMHLKKIQKSNRTNIVQQPIND